MAITSFSIVTTDAAPSTQQYHDRMPLVLEESQFDDWMRGPPEIAAGMMKPYGGAIEAWEVGAEVGNVKNNRPELIERVGLLWLQIRRAYVRTGIRGRRIMNGRHLFALVAGVIGPTGLMSPSVGRPDSA